MEDSLNATGTSASITAGSGPSQPIQPTSAQRALSLAEFVLGAAIVLGHNVYHVIPNEVPILFVLGLISLRVRDGGWGVIGLSWPLSWRQTVLFALAAAATRILLGALVIDPVTAHFWPPEPNLTPTTTTVASPRFDGRYGPGRTRRARCW